MAPATKSIATCFGFCSAAESFFMLEGEGTATCCSSLSVTLCWMTSAEVEIGANFVSGDAGEDRSFALPEEECRGGKEEGDAATASF